MICGGDIIISITFFYFLSHMVHLTAQRNPTIKSLSILLVNESRVYPEVTGFDSELVEEMNNYKKKILMIMEVTMLKKKTKELKNQTKTLNGNIKLMVNG